MKITDAILPAFRIIGPCSSSMGLPAVLGIVERRCLKMCATHEFHEVHIHILAFLDTELGEVKQRSCMCGRSHPRRDRVGVVVSERAMAGDSFGGSGLRRRVNGAGRGETASTLHGIDGRHGATMSLLAAPAQRRSACLWST